MILLGIDFETTGLDTEKLHITEIGCAFYDSDSQRIISAESAIVNIPAGASLSEEAASISNLDEKILDRYGISCEEAMKELFNKLVIPQALVAHNATMFEKKILLRYAKEMGLTMPITPWIDTAVDVDWAPHIRGKSLSHLAADHGFLNPFPHEALPDVLTMMKLISMYDIDKIYENAISPKIQVRAIVEFAQKEKARAAGFYWNAQSSKWLKTIREDQLLDQSAAWEFNFKLEQPSLGLTN